jgi:GTP-binding protein LepA
MARWRLGTITLRSWHWPTGWSSFLFNKTDPPSADVENTPSTVRFGPTPIKLNASAKEESLEVLEAIVQRIPPPSGEQQRPLKALLFDSWFDNYQGTVVMTRVFDGQVKAGTKIMLMSTHKVFEVMSVGVLTPKPKEIADLSPGEVGYIISGIKTVSDTKIGDTVTEADRPTTTPFPGYREVKPMVFCGLYAVDTGQFEDLRDALGKLRLNDSSFSYEPETSLALGFGFRCGFLGLLHMEIIQERLEREYQLELISTAPTVVYRVTLKTGKLSI